MERRNESFTLKDVIFNLLFIMLFVFILLWLFPSKSFLKDKEIANSKQLFNDNLTVMKEAAVSYFTNPRLPQVIGKSEKMTLSEMIDEKLLLELYDSNGEKCNINTSYVQITKENSDEYVLKIYLSCTDDEDYILVHLGCYDYCENDVCEIKEVFKYEYKKETPCTWTDFGAWSNWQTSYVAPTSTRKVETKTGTSTQDATISYTCPEGYSYNQTTKLCNKTVNGEEAKDATKVVTYNCSNYGSNYYVLKDGAYVLVNNQKVQTVVVSDENDTSYACKATTTVPAEKVTTYNCNQYNVDGKVFTLVGTACIYSYQSSSEYSVRKETYACKIKVCSDIAVYEPGVGIVYETSCTYKNTTCTKDVAYVSGYSCPKGGSLNGTTCTITNSASGNDSYYCLAGGSLSGTTCTTSDNKSINKNITYNCDKYGSDYLLDQTKCKKIINEVETENPTENKTCPTGYALNGTTCTKQITYYRYADKYCTGGSTDYKWSLSDKDEDLLNNGYVLTGKKEEVKEESK